MLLSHPHEDEAIHFIALIIPEIVAFKPAIGHIQYSSNLVIFGGLERLLSIDIDLQETE